MAERRFYRVREVCKVAGVSKGKVFAALKAGRLEGRKLDGVVLITPDSLDRWLATAVPWQPARGGGDKA